MTEREVTKNQIFRTIVKRVNNHQNNIDLLQDGTESRGSASSPKSYDSRSSVEDKVAKDIRQLPIPKTLKVKNGATGGSDSHDEDLSMEDDMSTGSRYVCSKVEKKIKR